MSERAWWQAVIRHRQLLVDAAVAAALYAMLMSTLRLLVEDPASPFFAPTGWPEYVAGAASTLPLALRRLAPLVVLGIVAGGVATFLVLQPVNLVAAHVAGLLAVYSAGRHGRPVARDVARGLALAALVVLFTLAESRPDAPDPGRAHPLGLGIALALYGSAWILAEQTRRAHEREEELAARTSQLAARTAELEAERARSARQAATEERLRIARELHDVLGHHVSVMGVQAAGAQRALPADANAAASALAAIESSSRQAVAEMQRVLTMLRDDDAPDQRLPGLAGLDELVDEIRRARLAVTVQIDDLPTLPVSIDLAALRVVQEALTNVLRHAGPGTCAWVRITVSAGALRIVVEDDGAGTPPRSPALSGTGHGLLGLRERVAVHGGRLETGASRTGGFRVAALLPLDARADASVRP